MLRLKGMDGREPAGRIASSLRSVAVLSAGVVAVLLGPASPVIAQVASPLQAGHYSPTVANVRDLARPPAGLFVLWYSAYSSSRGFIDRNGDKFESIRLSELNAALPDIDVDLKLKGFVSVPTLFWASHFEVLGGARYMAGVAPNFVSADVTFDTSRPGLIDPGQVVTRELGGKSTGFSDTFVVPLGLSWGLTKFDITTMYGLYVPTGKYESGSPDNVGLGFWTHQFQAFGYYYPRPDKSTAVMAGLTYELNGKIEDVDVRPGSRFTLEWGLSQYFSDRFEATVQGGHNWQITDDTGDDVLQGILWDPSYHDRKSTVALGATYWAWNERLALSGKYGFDFGVRQRFENDTVLLNVTFLTGALTGGGGGS